MWDFVQAYLKQNGYNYNMGEHYSNLGAFYVDQRGRTLNDMSFEGVNYVKYYP
jgi:hypothetical protein